MKYYLVMYKDMGGSHKPVKPIHTKYTLCIEHALFHSRKKHSQLSEVKLHNFLRERRVPWGLWQGLRHCGNILFLHLVPRYMDVFCL